VVVLAGKGHERGQDIGGRVLPFDDAEVARAALTRMFGEKHLSRSRDAKPR
jgi:UDP-N-acetylmuramoyl-L-alanyl-D-glutamate--2,6-diaminopimelate ligase